MKKRSILFLIIALITLLALFAFSSCDGDENVDGEKGDVFYEAGSCNGVTVSAPCIVMVSDDSISVSDPTHKLSSITVSVDGTGMTFETAELCGATVTKSR